MALRLLVLKADGSVLVHSDGGSYKPLNWMSPPCRIREEPGVWRVVNRSGEELRITIEEIIHDTQHNLGLDPGLQKDGVEAHLQELLAADPTLLGDGLTLIRREYPTAIGPVDLLCRERSGTAAVEGEVDRTDADDGVDTANVDTAKPRHWAVEVKRRASIDAVEQLTRYLDLLNRNPLLTPVGGILAAQGIAPQARTLAEIRGFRCVVIDYDELRGKPRDEMTLF
jgi:hypothetical protein